MVEFGCRQLHPSVGAHRQAHCSTSGPRQTRVEAPVHPIHHRRAHACAQRCAAIPPDLQCESRLRSLLDSALGLCDAERSSQVRSQTRFALKIRRDHRTLLSARMCSPMMDGSNSSLQARSPCTTAAALCLPVAILTHLMPRAPKLAHASLHS